jgi:hypothetical protein
MDVRTFKLTTGEELVGELITATATATGTGYRVKRPLAVMVGKNEMGADSMGWGEWPLTADPDQVYEFLDHGLLCAPLKSHEIIAKSYKDQVDPSPLILPPEPTGKILLG